MHISVLSVEAPIVIAAAIFTRITTAHPHWAAFWLISLSTTALMVGSQTVYKRRRGSGRPHRTEVFPLDDSPSSELWVARCLHDNWTRTFNSRQRAVAAAHRHEPRSKPHVLASHSDPQV